MADIALKLKLAFDSDDLCDVSLKLESGEDIKCHSLVLKLSSSFFKTRLESRWMHGESPQIIDCSSFSDEIVKCMIDFMYGTVFPFNLENIYDCIKCSDFFAIDSLTLECSKFLLECISVNNIFFVLQTSYDYLLQNVIDKCLEFIDCNIERILLTKFEQFYVLPAQTLLHIISRNTFYVHDELLFDHLLCWVDQQQDTCAAWALIYPNICFLNMSLEYFVSTCIPTNVVPTLVCNKILLYLSSSEKVEFPDPQFKNKILFANTANYVFVKRFHRVSREPQWLTDTLNGDRIILSVSNDIQLKGVSIYGKPDTSCLVQLSLHNTFGNSLVKSFKYRLDFVKNSCILIFKEPILLNVGPKYTLVCMKEGNAFFGTNGLKTGVLRIREGSVNINFENANAGNTTVSEGQFEGFIFGTN